MHWWLWILCNGFPPGHQTWISSCSHDLHFFDMQHKYSASLRIRFSVTISRVALFYDGYWKRIRNWRQKRSLHIEVLYTELFLVFEQNALTPYAKRTTPWVVHGRWKVRGNGSYLSSCRMATSKYMFSSKWCLSTVFRH